jgi:hypothetical protein
MAVLLFQESAMRLRRIAALTRINRREFNAVPNLML